MALKGTRKLIATITGILAIIGLNIAHLIYGDGSGTVDLTTTILSLVAISGIAGYEIRTQGDIDRVEVQGGMFELPDVDVEEGLVVPPAPAPPPREA